MKIRLFPRSLAGQLLVLLLAAVLAAQAASLVIFAQSRRAAIDAAAREQVLGRMAALVRLIEDSPAEQRPRILAASGSSHLIYSIGPAPLVADDVGTALDGLPQAQLGAIFGESRDVRATFAEDGLPDTLGHSGGGRRFGRLDGDDDDAMPQPAGAGRMAGEAGMGWRFAMGAHPFRAGGGPFGPGGLRGRQPAIAVSVRLADGAWLNSETLLPPPVLLAWTTLVSTLLTALAIAIAVAFSVRRITRPLRELAVASDRLGRGESVEALSERGPEEIAAASRAFNAMQARVKRFVTDRTRMIAAITHDLRTPLTALRLRAEFVDDDETREKIIDAVDEMTRMSAATLRFARDDASQEETRLTDLSALVAAVADDFSDLDEDVAVQAPARLELMVRPVALRRALRNLVENAIRYGQRARIRIAADSAEVRISVDDDGPGIPDDKMEEVFAPFTRLESSRNQETGGVGLGLSTARSIVHAHGGVLTLENRPEGGLCATIRLPRPAARG